MEDTVRAASKDWNNVWTAGCWDFEVQRRNLYCIRSGRCPSKWLFFDLCFEMGVGKLEVFLKYASLSGEKAGNIQKYGWKFLFDNCAV